MPRENLIIVYVREQSFAFLELPVPLLQIIYTVFLLLDVNTMTSSLQEGIAINRYFEPDVVQLTFQTVKVAFMATYKIIHFYPLVFLVEPEHIWSLQD